MRGQNGKWVSPVPLSSLLWLGSDICLGGDSSTKLVSWELNPKGAEAEIRPTRDDSSSIGFLPLALLVHGATAAPFPTTLLNWLVLLSSAAPKSVLLH